MLREFYIPEGTPNRLIYYFNSIGSKGTIRKVIIFQSDKDERFNLAFGDLVNGKFDNKVISNNQDLYKVISTVAFTIVIFFQNFPTATIEIEAVDEKRLRLYNAIFKRKKEEIMTDYNIFAYRNDKFEPYSDKYFYTKFRITLKYF